MLRIVQAPAKAPISLEEAKLHLRVRHGHEDALIEAFINAATLHAQATTQRLFISQTVEWILHGWAPCIRLPIAPVLPNEIDSIKYVDWTTQQQATLQPAQYVARASGPTVEIIPSFGSIWPTVYSWSSEPVVIRFTAGAEVAEVPENVKTAIRMIVSHLYAHRESVVISNGGVIAEVPQGVNALLMPEVWY